MIDVSYNGKSVRQLGAIVDEITPMPRASRRTTVVEVPGRSGALHIDDEAYSTVRRTLSLAVRDEIAVQRVNAWCVVSGELRVSNEPGYYYRAIQSGELDWENPAKRIYRVSIAFDLDPFCYLDSGLHVVSFAAPGALVNPTTTVSEPSITLAATGDVTLYVGGYIVTLVGLSGGITLDCERQLAYYNNKPIPFAMRGDFPRLAPGKNDFSWIGAVTKFEIQPRWRTI